MLSDLYNVFNGIFVLFQVKLPPVVIGRTLQMQQIKTRMKNTLFFSSLNVAVAQKILERAKFRVEGLHSL